MAVLLTTRDLAERLQVSTRHVRNLEIRGALPPAVVLSTRCKRWTEESVANWLAHSNADAGHGNAAAR